VLIKHLSSGALQFLNGVSGTSFVRQNQIFKKKLSSVFFKNNNLAKEFLEKNNVSRFSVKKKKEKRNYLEFFVLLGEKNRTVS